MPKEDHLEYESTSEMKTFRPLWFWALKENRGVRSYYSNIKTTTHQSRWMVWVHLKVGYIKKKEEWDDSVPPSVEKTI